MIFSRIPTLGLIASICAVSSTTNAEALVRFDTIAVTGEQVPGIEPGINFESFSGLPVINSAGSVAFHSRLTGMGMDGTDNQGIFLQAGGSLAVVARNGIPAPDTEPNLKFGSLGTPVLNDAGQTAFTASLSGIGVNNQTVYAGSTGMLELVARSGEPAPDTGPGVNLGPFFSPPVLNNAGQTAFLSVLGNTPGVSGVVSEFGDELRLVARGGIAAPGTGPDVFFKGAFRSDPVVNGLGQTAFHAELAGSGVSRIDQGIFSEASGQLSLVARFGNPAPDVGPDVNFHTLSNDPQLNNSGQIVFTATLTGTGVDSTNDRGIFSESNGVLGLVARFGDPAPVPETGVNFGGVVGPVLNDAGQIVFVASLTGTGVDSLNAEGIFSYSSSGKDLVARSGGLVPGTTAGVRMIGFEREITINNVGLTAFHAKLAGTDVDNFNDRGLFVVDSAGIFQLVVREGDMFDTDPDPQAVNNRTISRSTFVTGAGERDGHSGSLNDAGQLAFHLSFTDGSSGVFVATIGVPEPASLALLSVVGLVVLGRRCR